MSGPPGRRDVRRRAPVTCVPRVTSANVRAGGVGTGQDSGFRSQPGAESLSSGDTGDTPLRRRSRTGPLPGRKTAPFEEPVVCLGQRVTTEGSGSGPTVSCYPTIYLLGWRCIYVQFFLCRNNVLQLRRFRHQEFGLRGSLEVLDNFYV